MLPHVLRVLRLHWSCLATLASGSVAHTPHGTVFPAPWGKVSAVIKGTLILDLKHPFDLNLSSQKRSSATIFVLSNGLSYDVVGD
ncbi:hypothetical protein BDV29DRAFT_180652 [Aspergillus leporis]|jgi:hypothetical protein|uniref:Secreted protein n=1 Tax=Aspergillus leporis TaxID=41062 RepID=A0A5N5WPX6_9EURO|nr:hypothetical protein BDV29DRAFT_180652 [Aspergillus leporis]